MRRTHWAVLIGLLIAGVTGFVLVPFIGKVRDAAARMTCVCHCKCLALALHNYAESYGKKLPAGTVPNADLPPERRLSWLVVVLPYIESDAVFKQFDLSLAADHPGNRAAVGNRFRNFVCPSSGEYERTDGGGTWKSPSPLTHYVGVAGVGADAAALPAGHPRAGTFGHDRRLGFGRDDIPDGTANTLLLIETASSPGHWAFGGPPTVRRLDAEAAPYVGEGRPFGGYHGNQTNWFVSRPQLCNVALADGSVRSISDSVAAEVLDALATVAGGETLPAEW